MDAYCERVEPGFWAEPLNAVSNLAFLVAAIAVWASGRQASARTLALYLVSLAAVRRSTRRDQVTGGISSHR